MKRFVFLVSFLSMIFSLAPCSSANNEMDYTAFLALLTKHGYSYQELEEPLVLGTVFSASAEKPIVVGNDFLFVWEFDTNELVENNAELVRKDGYAVENKNFSWTHGPPHFFKKDRIIVMYQGVNEQMIDFLAEFLGDPFAGARAAAG